MRRHDKPPAAKDNDAKPRVNYVAPAGLARHALQALAPASTVDSVQSSPLSSAPSSSLHDSPAGKEVPQWGSTAAASTSATPVAATGDRGRSKSRDSQRDMMLDSPRKASVGLGKQAASSGPSSRKGAADTLHSPRRSTRSENIASPPVARVYAESSTVPPRSAGKTHWGDTSVATEDSLPSPKAQAASKEQLSTKKIQPSLVKVASTAKTTSPEGTEILIQLKSDEMPTAVNSPPFKEKQQTSKRELAFKKKQAAALARFATNKESTDKGLEQEPVANVQKEEQKHEPLPVKDQVMKQGSSQEIGKHKSASNEPSTTDIATADSAMPPPPLPLKRDTAAARNVNDHDLTLSIVPESTPTRRDIPVREGCRVESLTPGTPSEPLSRQRTITDGGASRSSSIVNMQVDDEKGDKMDVDDVDDDEEDVEFKEDSTAMDLLHSVCAILLAPSVTEATASMHYHSYMRFVRTSAKSTDPLIIRNGRVAAGVEQRLLLMACVNVAAKSTEVPRKVRDIMNAMHATIYPEAEYYKIDDDFWKIRESVGRVEFMLLPVIKFHLHQPTAYPWIVRIVDAHFDPVENSELKLESPPPPPPPEHFAPPAHPAAPHQHFAPPLNGPSAEAPRHWARIGWTIVNDAYRSASVCLDFSPRIIGVASMYIAARSLELPLPLGATEWLTIWSGDEGFSKASTCISAIIASYYRAAAALARTERLQARESSATATKERANINE